MTYITRDIPKIKGFLSTLSISLIATVIFFVFAANDNPAGIISTQIVGTVGLVIGFISMILLAKDLAKAPRI